MGGCGRWLGLCLLLALAGPGGALQNVTAQLFGAEAYGTLAAFGDFNSDKQTDLFVLRGGERSGGGSGAGAGAVRSRRRSGGGREPSRGARRGSRSRLKCSLAERGRRAAAGGCGVMPARASGAPFGLTFRQPPREGAPAAWPTDAFSALRKRGKAFPVGAVLRGAGSWGPGGPSGPCRPEVASASPWLAACSAPWLRKRSG